MILGKWMTANKSKLNKDKTELIVISSQHRPRLQLDTLTFGSESVFSTNAARNIGVTMDDKINFEKQVASICKYSFYHMRNIARIRRFLSEESIKALQVVHAFVTCKLDNCNSLLYGLPKNQVEKLQRVQNCAARLVVAARRHDHIMITCTQRFHWLPVEQRTIFIFFLFTFKALNGLAPSYLSDLVKFYVPEYDLRSSSQKLLAVPFRETKSYGDRAFYAPKLPLPHQ